MLLAVSCSSHLNATVSHDIDDITCVVVPSAGCKSSKLPRLQHDFFSPSLLGLFKKTKQRAQALAFA